MRNFPSAVIRSGAVWNSCGAGGGSRGRYSRACERGIFIRRHKACGSCRRAGQDPDSVLVDPFFPGSGEEFFSTYYFRVAGNRNRSCSTLQAFIFIVFRCIDPYVLFSPPSFFLFPSSPPSLFPVAVTQTKRKARANGPIPFLRQVQVRRSPAGRPPSGRG